MIDEYGNDINWIPTIEASKGPMYQKIAKAIEEDIQTGLLVHGDKMPPQRVIANYLKLNHGTVTRAYKLCEEKGLLRATIGKGTFVSGSAGLPVELLTDHEESNIISLGMALPVYELNDFIEAMIREVLPNMDYNVALKYCPPEGHLRHRYIASNWLKQYNIEADPNHIIISAGTQNALATILISQFTKSDRILVDTLTYTGLKSLAEYLGIILVPVKCDGDGMDIEDLRTTCKRERRIKGIYLMPDCHNPTSITLSQDKRKAIAEVVINHNLLLIEDGTCSFTLKDKMVPISTMAPNQSFYIHGTSKAISPSLRLSYLVSPKAYVKRLQQGINNISWMASPFTSEIMSLLQSTGRYDEIVRRKLMILEARNRVFDEVFEAYEKIPAQTALFRYLKIQEGSSGQYIERKALEKGIQIFDVDRFLVGVNHKHHAIRVAVSAPRDYMALQEGLLGLRTLLEEGSEEYNPMI